MVLLQPLLSTFIALIIMGQIRVWGQEIIPNLKEQVIQAGTDLKLTCRLHPNAKGDEMFWQLPHSKTGFWWTQLSDVKNRFQNTTGPEPRESTMILSNTRPEDTGFYGCATTFDARTDLPFSKQYVYVTSNEKLVFIDPEEDYLFVVKKNGFISIPCKPTHPNVRVSLNHSFIHELPIGYNITKDEIEKFWLTDEKFIKKNTEISLNPESNSRWSFDPKTGLTLKNATFTDTGDYTCVGRMNNVEQETKFFINFSGVDLEIVGHRKFPNLGEEVSLICRTIDLNSNLTWFYKIDNTVNSGEMQRIDENNPPKGIQVLQIKNSNFRFTTSRLDIVITKETPTTFRCEKDGDRETISETISFKLNNDTNDLED